MSDTTLTIIGMIVAFLTASITPIIVEALKNRTRLQNLETALYREMLYNFLFLNVFDMQETPLGERASFINSDGLRVECYNHALQNELPLFYSLAESGTINLLQGNIKQMIALATDIKSFSEDEKIQTRLQELAHRSSGFQNLFAKANFNGTLNNALVRSIASTREFNIIKSKANEQKQNQ